MAGEYFVRLSLQWFTEMEHCLGCSDLGRCHCGVLAVTPGEGCGQEDIDFLEPEDLCMCSKPDFISSKIRIASPFWSDLRTAAATHICSEFTSCPVLCCEVGLLKPSQHP